MKTSTNELCGLNFSCNLREKKILISELWPTKKKLDQNGSPLPRFYLVEID